MPQASPLRSHALLAALMLVLAALILPARARAWDPEADRVVARLAYERLTPSAKAKVDALLGSGFKVANTPCEATSLADAPEMTACLKDRRGVDFMRGVIYDPLPICAPPPRAKPPCADGHCASTLLKQEILTLRAPAASPGDKAMALLAVTYLMSELHQPLHTADNNDRNGDRIRVTTPGDTKGISLYGVWDEDLVADAIGDAEDGLPYVRALAEVHGAEWAQGNLDSWLAETHEFAVSVVYGRLPIPPACNKLPDQPEPLRPNYFAAAAPLVRQQLAKAGVRLATVLNAALGSEPPAAAAAAAADAPVAPVAPVDAASAPATADAVPPAAQTDSAPLPPATDAPHP
jgi:hypothetical protein